VDTLVAGKIVELDAGENNERRPLGRGLDRVDPVTCAVVGDCDPVEACCDRPLDDFLRRDFPAAPVARCGGVHMEVERNALKSLALRDHGSATVAVGLGRFGALCTVGAVSRGRRRFPWPADTSALSSCVQMMASTGVNPLIAPQDDSFDPRFIMSLPSRISPQGESFPI
jgi:hypothetical protein